MSKCSALNPGGLNGLRFIFILCTHDRAHRCTRSAVLIICRAKPLAVRCFVCHWNFMVSLHMHEMRTMRGGGVVRDSFIACAHALRLCWRGRKTWHVAHARWHFILYVDTCAHRCVGAIDAYCSQSVAVAHVSRSRSRRTVVRFELGIEAGRGRVG